MSSCSPAEIGGSVTVWIDSSTHQPVDAARHVASVESDANGGGVFERERRRVGRYFALNREPQLKLRDDGRGLGVGPGLRDAPRAHRKLELFARDGFESQDFFERLPLGFSAKRQAAWSSSRTFGSESVTGTGSDNRAISVHFVSVGESIVTDFAPAPGRRFMSSGRGGNVHGIMVSPAST